MTGSDSPPPRSDPPESPLTDTWTPQPPATVPPIQWASGPPAMPDFASGPTSQWGTPSGTETPRRRIWIVVGVLAALIVASLVGVAIFAPSFFGGVADALDPNNRPVRDVQAGECFDQDTVPTQGETVSFVTVVDCAESHDAEMFARYAIGGSSSYPGEGVVAGNAERGCVERFAEFMGIVYDQSAMDVGYFYPLSENWSLGDRDAQCYVTHPTGEQLTGSLRGARR